RRFRHRTEAAPPQVRGASDTGPRPLTTRRVTVQPQERGQTDRMLSRRHGCCSAPMGRPLPQNALVIVFASSTPGALVILPGGVAPDLFRPSPWVHGAARSAFPGRFLLGFAAHDSCSPLDSVFSSVPGSPAATSATGVSSAPASPAEASPDGVSPAG